MIFLDSLENRIAPLTVLDWQASHEINKASQLKLTATKGLPKSGRIIFGGKEYIAAGVEEAKSKSEEVEIFAEESIAELAGKLISDSRPNTLLAALTAITSGTRWQIGEFPETTGRSLSFFRISALEALKKTLEAYGLEMETEYIFSGRTITRKLHLRTRIGESRGRRTTINTDATEIKRIFQDDQAITRLYGYGKGEELESGAYGRRINVASVNEGLEYIEDDDARIAYGIGKNRLHYEGVLIYEDIEDPQELLDAMTADFQILKTPKITYEGKIVDLGIYDDKLGDDITILDETLGISIKGRILKLVETPKEKKATIGNLLPGVGSEIARIKNLEQRIQDYDILRNALINVDSRDYLQGVMDRINTELNATGGYASLIPGRGIIIPNAATEAEATQIIELGGGFLRIANSKDQYGNWVFRTIADGRGVIATEIIAGILTGGNVSFNLEAGTFLIGDPDDPNLYWDGANLLIDGQNIEFRANESLTQVISSEISTSPVIEEMSGELKEYTDTEASILRSEITATATSWEISLTEIREQQDLTDGDIQELMTYLRYSGGVLELGESGSPMTLQLTNEQMQFLESGAVVMYINGRKVYVDSLEVLSSIIIGAHLIEKYQIDGVDDTIVRKV
jgi:phage minor structural protein